MLETKVDNTVFALLLFSTSETVNLPPSMQSVSQSVKVNVKYSLRNVHTFTGSQLMAVKVHLPWFGCFRFFLFLALRRFLLHCFFTAFTSFTAHCQNNWHTVAAAAAAANHQTPLFTFLCLVCVPSKSVCLLPLNVHVFKNDRFGWTQWHTVCFLFHFALCQLKEPITGNWPSRAQLADDVFAVNSRVEKCSVKKSNQFFLALVFFSFLKLLTFVLLWI